MIISALFNIDKQKGYNNSLCYIVLSVFLTGKHPKSPKKKITYVYT